ncbi:MAG: ABC transporter permease [Crocinitomicaceae bacterium]
MRKLFASIHKELLLLINDKVGLILMFMMPILLVFIITIVQDSTFKLVNDNNIEIIVVNKDKGALGDSLSGLLEESGVFKITNRSKLSQKEIQKTLLSDNQLLALWIPENFSQQLTAKAQSVSTEMLSEFDIIENASVSPKIPTKIALYYDPILQENFRTSISGSIQSFLGALESRLMIEQLYVAMGFEDIPEAMEEKFFSNQITIDQISANTSSGQAIPNSTQHNVPAWSIFAMFFMVISLGSNIVKERLSGSFVRLQTIPSSFSLVLLSKMFTYLFVALLQLTVIFMLGKFVFPLIGLPTLSLPSNILGLFIISILSAFSAISFAMLVGTFAKTNEQANGFGAITIIILAAIGGIWVPTFVMPSYMQVIGNISPLHWCLEGYYTLFLKGGDWYLLFPTILFLILFILACQILTYSKLKIQNYI